jgi:hypothetical protein
MLAVYVLEFWTTTLPENFSIAELIALNFSNSTYALPHPEFKSDMAFEQLLSEKFDTNIMAFQLTEVAMNLLRLIAQNTLNMPYASVRRCVSSSCSQTSSYQYGDAGGDVQGHAHDPACWAISLGFARE